MSDTNRICDTCNGIGCPTCGKTGYLPDRRRVDTRPRVNIALCANAAIKSWQAAAIDESVTYTFREIAKAVLDAAGVEYVE